MIYGKCFKKQKLFCQSDYRISDPLRFFSTCFSQKYSFETLFMQEVVSKWIYMYDKCFFEKHKWWILHAYFTIFDEYLKLFMCTVTVHYIIFKNQAEKLYILCKM